MESKRYSLFDTIRGITIISMIAYHACWDLVYFGLGIKPKFLQSIGPYIWQQSICYTFILLSGFCLCFGKHHLKRGLMSLGGGIIISLVTSIAVPEARDIFGVLWLIGSSILIVALIDKVLPKSKWCDALGLLLSIILFISFRNINKGYLGFESMNLLKLPEKLYNGWVMTFLGFQDPTFYSSDYFSLIPWIFLFTTGYFLNKMLQYTHFFDSPVLRKEIAPLSFMGRHSLIIYMLHQVILYGITYLIWYIHCL